MDNIPEKYPIFTFMNSFKKLFSFGKKSVITVDTLNETTREGINKAYIPKFLYKPPFGYPRFANMTYIRYLAQTPYCEMCISTIIDEIASIEWDIVPNDGMEEQEDEAEKEEIKNFFLNPNTNRESFEEVFIRMPVRDILEVNSAVLNKVYNMKEELVEVVARDGATFTKNPDVHGMFTNRDDIIMPTRIVDDTVGAEYLNPYTEITATSSREKAAYFQYGWIAGPIPVPFGRKEIIWIEKMKRTDDHYGFSPVQVLAKNLQMLLYMIESDLEYYNDNNVPKGIIGLDESDADEIKAFKEQWFETQRTKDEFGSWKKIMNKVPIVNKVPTFTRIEFSASEMQVIEKQKWYSKMVWSCYSEDTEILTENGWRLFKDLQSEKVARVNPKNLNIDFVNPISKQVYDYDGELYYYKHRNVDLAVTPDHKMLYKSQKDYEQNKETDWNTSQAKDEMEMYLPQAGYYEGTKIDNVTFTSANKYVSKLHKSTETFKIEGNEFVEFMGFWLGDGWIETGNNRICLCASEVYPENIDFCKKILSKIAPDYKEKVSLPSAMIMGKSVNINGNMHYFRFSNKAFSDYLSQFKKAHNKYIPEIIKNCNKEQRKLFFESYMLADGSIGKKGRNNTYFSMSKRLIDDLQEMYVKEGIASNINEYNNGYNLTVRKSQFKKEQNTSLIEKKHIKKAHYEGKVYDVTVPDHHFLVVRRNGRVSISGNCFGVTAVELGYTEDAKGSANQIVQSKVFRKKAIDPMLRNLESDYNMSIVSEFGYVGTIKTKSGKTITKPKYKFMFKKFDVDEEKNKYELYKLQVEAGLKTINECRTSEGLDDVEWGDNDPRAGAEQPEQEGEYGEFGDDPNDDFNDREDNALDTDDDDDNDQEPDTDPKKKLKSLRGPPEKPTLDPDAEEEDDEDNEEDGEKKKKKEKKAQPTDNPLILKENERPTGYTRLESAIKYVNKTHEDDIKKLLAIEMGKHTLKEVKGINEIIAKLKALLGIGAVMKITKEIIKNNYMKGWDEAEQDLNINISPDPGAIDYMSNYTYDNIKGMNDDIAEKLRSVMQRSFMDGSSLEEVKAEITKVFDVGNNRVTMIARTESNRAAAMGRQHGYEKSGVNMNKYISVHLDDRTSAICKSLNKKYGDETQAIPLNDKFELNDETWLVNPFHVNCRSSVLYVVADEDKE